MNCFCFSCGLIVCPSRSACWKLAPQRGDLKGGTSWRSLEGVSRSLGTSSSCPLSASCLALWSLSLSHAPPSSVIPAGMGSSVSLKWRQCPVLELPAPELWTEYSTVLTHSLKQSVTVTGSGHGLHVCLLLKPTDFITSPGCVSFQHNEHHDFTTKWEKHLLTCHSFPNNDVIIF